MTVSGLSTSLWGIIDLVFCFPVDTVFDAVSECQSLHPDPDLSTDSEDNEEDGGDDPVIIDSIESVNDDSGYFRTAEDLQYLSPEGQRTLEHLERLLATSEETKNGKYLYLYVYDNGSVFRYHKLP